MEELVDCGHYCLSVVHTTRLASTGRLVSARRGIDIWRGLTAGSSGAAGIRQYRPAREDWYDTSWNPTAGCSAVSPGCDNCWAMRVAAPTRPNGRRDRHALHRTHQDGAGGSGLDRGNSRSRRFVDLAAVPPSAAAHRRQPDVGFVSRGSDDCDDRSGACRDRRRPLAYLSWSSPSARSACANITTIRKRHAGSPRKSTGWHRRFRQTAALLPSRRGERPRRQFVRASDAPVARERSASPGTGLWGFRGSDTQLRARHRQQSGRSGSNHGRYRTYGLGSRSKIKAGSGASATCSKCPLRCAGCASNRCSTE